jgi:nucleoside-diphosphate-sugar epimerase
MDEASPTNPQTTYAQCKVNVERDLMRLADSEFCVTFLRNATAYGPSPRMRFDIVLNDLCAQAWTKKKIAMVSDGSPWRPIVHIEDIVEAVRCTIEAPAGTVNGEIFNVGVTGENYRIRELADIVAQAFSCCEVSAGPPSGDKRSYRVSFEKIASKLPGYQARWTAHDGAAELRQLFERIDLLSQTFEFRSFTRLKQLKYLQQTGQINHDLIWTGLR